jgi:hypothetical protein
MNINHVTGVSEGRYKKIVVPIYENTHRLQIQIHYEHDADMTDSFRVHTLIGITLESRGGGGGINVGRSRTTCHPDIKCLTLQGGCGRLPKVIGDLQVRNQQVTYDRQVEHFK